MKIRKTKPEELKLVMKLYENARSFMTAHGNPSQWGTSHPGEDLILRDIEEGNSYVCEEHGAVTAVFYYREGGDPTYTRIYDGQKKADPPRNLLFLYIRNFYLSFCIPQ